MKVHSTNLCIFNQIFSILAHLFQEGQPGPITFEQIIAHPDFHGHYTKGLQFLIPYAQAQSDLLSLAPKKYTTTERISIIQENRSAFMQFDGFFLSEDGKDVILYAPHSTSGITRTEKYSNTYIAFHFDGSQWHFFVGAAQGASMNFELSEEMRQERYKKEALYQMSLGIIAKTMTDWLNGHASCSVPTCILLANYLSLSKGWYSDPFSIAQRYKAITELLEHGVKYAQIRDQVDKIVPGWTNILWHPEEKSGTISIVFSQRGLNLDRFISGRTCNQKFCDTISQMLKDIKKTDRIAESVLKEIVPSGLDRAFSSSTFFRHAIGALPSLWLFCSKYLPANLSLPTNRALHIEALKALLVERIGGIVVGGCLSAKDRTGAVRLLLHSYQDYIALYQEVPPAIGSLEFYKLSVEKQSFLLQRFFHHYTSGQAQFVPHANTPGTSGLKNLFWILGGELRQYLTQQLMTSQTLSAEKKSLLSLDSSQILACLNKFYKKSF